MAQSKIGEDKARELWDSVSGATRLKVISDFYLVPDMDYWSRSCYLKWKDLAITDKVYVWRAIEGQLDSPLFKKGQ